MYYISYFIHGAALSYIQPANLALKMGIWSVFWGPLGPIINGDAGIERFGYDPLAKEILPHKDLLSLIG